MIVYNVQRRWFTMKNDAEAYRREQGLPVGSTFKLVMNSREELAGLLNGLCGIEGEVVKVPPDTAPQEYQNVIQRSAVTAPDCVPRFLIEEWDAKARGKYRL